MRRNKKGFTIVELVIVIAVIGVLAAVLIPTFVNLTNKANQAADDSLVKNLNTALSTQEGVPGDVKNNTLHDAVVELEDYGYKLPNLITKSHENTLLWNSKTNRFLLAKNLATDKEQNSSKNMQNVDYFHIQDNLNNPDGYSIYAGNGFNLTEVDELNVGFDVGFKTIESINYESNTGNSVIIRTNGGSLTVNASADNVSHYGYADSIEIKSVKPQSYREHGTVPFLEIAKGHIVLESGSKVSHLHFDKKAAENAFDSIKVTKSSGVELPSFSRDSIGTATLAAPVLVVEFKTQGVEESEYVWLVETGVYDKMAVTSSSTAPTDAEGTQNVSNASATAQAIATQIANAVGEGETIQDGGVDKEATKNATIDNYYNEEESPVNIPVGTTAYYSHEGNLILLNDDNIFEDLPDGITLNICKDVALGSTLELVDKSITIKGIGTTKPLITGNIYIHHTSGNHMVKFSNLAFLKNSTSQRDHIKDESVCTSANDANSLIIDGCDFDATEVVTSNQNSVVAVLATEGMTGTALVFTNNNVRTTSGGAYAEAISTGCTEEVDKTNQTKHARNVVQPIIDNNTFAGNYYYGFIGSSVSFTNNTMNFTNGYRAFQLYSVAPTANTDGELNIVILGNTFSNFSAQLFQIYNADNVLGQSYVVFDVAGTNEENANHFENVAQLGKGGAGGSNFASQLAIEFESQNKQFEGIADPYIKCYIGDVLLTKSGNVDTGYMTLPDGVQTTTYTQAVAPQGGRTGFYITVSDLQLWYFADKGLNEHYFIDNEDNVYVVRIVAGEATEASLQLTNLPEPEFFESSDRGKIYNASFSINTFENNTLYNASATRDGNKVTVTPLEGKSAADINLFISDIGGKSKLLVTNDAGATAGDDTMIYVVPTGTAQINAYGAWNVTIDGSILNYAAYGKQNITVNENKSVTGTLLINSANAIGSTVVNNGSIRRLYAYARTDVTNNSNITALRFARTESGGTIEILKTIINAHNSTLVNYGNIGSVSSFTKINVMNEEGASIGSMWLSSLDQGVEYSLGSVIINNGTMCAGKGQNIDIYVRCTFTNNGTIGAEGRAPSTNHGSASATEACENYGGVIYIGNYAGGSYHDGLVFTNNGTIYAGARHNGTSHDQITFWVCGAKNANVTITITNNSTANGHNIKTTFGGQLTINTTLVF